MESSLRPSLPWASKGYGFKKSAGASASWVKRTVRMAPLNQKTRFKRTPREIWPGFMGWYLIGADIS